MNQSRTAWWAALAVVAGAMAAAPAAGLAQAAGEPWSVPRTPGGRPDLQGVWANNTATPLERPAALGDKAVLTDEELARLEARYAEIFASGESDAAFADSVFTAALGDDDSFSSRDTATGNYNQFWLVDRDFDNRTSLVVDPPDGRLPSLTPEARRQVDARAAHLADNPASSWTDRRLQERCITFGMPNLFAGYNTYYQIVQTPDHVVFLPAVADAGGATAGRRAGRPPSKGGSPTTRRRRGPTDGCRSGASPSACRTCSRATTPTTRSSRPRTTSCSCTR